MREAEEEHDYPRLRERETEREREREREIYPPLTRLPFQEQTKEIGILRSLGLRRWALRRIYVSEAWIIIATSSGQLFLLVVFLLPLLSPPSFCSSLSFVLFVLLPLLPLHFFPTVFFSCSSRHCPGSAADPSSLLVFSSSSSVSLTLSAATGIVIGIAVGWTMALQQVLFTQLPIPFSFPWLITLVILACSMFLSIFASLGPINAVLRLPVVQINRLLG